jgi:hypothetical protein
MVCVLLFLWCGAVYSASKQYVSPESPIKFSDAGTQAPNATFSLSGLTNGTGRVSDRYDRGAGAHAALYEWRCTISLTGTNVVDASIEWYISTSDGTNPDGQLGTADAAIAGASSSKRNNLKPLGLTVVDQTTTNTPITASGWTYIPSRFISLVAWNGTSLPFQTSTITHSCTLTPVPIEAQ